MSSIKTNIIANYIGRSWTALIAILLIPIYIKFIGVEAYGLVGFFTVLSSVIGILDLGIGSTVNRELAKRSVNQNIAGTQRDLVRTLELIYWGIAILTGTIVLIGASFISNKWINAESLNPDLVLHAVQLMAISIVLRFPLSLYQGGLMGLQKQVLVNIILVVNGTLRGFGAVLVLWLVSPTIEAFFIWQVIISLLDSLVFFIAMWASLPKSEVKSKFRLNIIKDIWRYAAAISANALIGVILSQLDKIILSKMLPLKMFAYYTIAATVASSIWMIIIPFNNALFPSLVKLYEGEKIEELKKLFHDASQVLSFLLLPLSFVLIFFSKEILLLWMNDPVVAENSYLILSFLVIGTALNGLVSLPANCAPAFGWPMLITYTNLLQAIVIIPLIVGMVYWKQGIGASIAWIVLNSTYIIFMVPFFFKRFLLSEQKKWYFKDILLPTIVAFSIVAFSKIIAPSMTNKFAILGWVSITGIITVIFTGLSMVHIKKILRQQWGLLFNS